MARTHSRWAQSTKPETATAHPSPSRSRCSDGQSDTRSAPVADGPHTFRVRGIGNTGVPGPATSRSYTVDATPPSTTITAGPTGEVDVPSVSFAFSSSESAAGFDCRLDGGPWLRCDEGTYTAQDMSEGPHVFEVSAVDRVGNEDPTPDSRDFPVDTRPRIDSGPAEGAVARPRPTFTFSSPSAASFECRFDANPYAPCSGANSHIPGSRLSTGGHIFSVRGITATGKTLPAVTRHFKVDATHGDLPWRASTQRAGRICDRLLSGIGPVAGSANGLLPG